MSSKAMSLFAGPWFDLTMELGPVGDHERVVKAMSAIWSCSSVKGRWRKESEIGDDKLSMSADDFETHTYGLLNLDSGEPLPFVVNLVSENHVDLPDPLPSGETITLFGTLAKECSDWLNVSLPFNALSQRYSFEQTFELGSEAWVGEMCLVLAHIADAVHKEAGIECGVLGEEVSGCWRRPSAGRLKESDQGVGYTAVLDADVIERRGGFVVSPDLWGEIKPRIVGKVMSSGLVYVPVAAGAQLNADAPAR